MLQFSFSCDFSILWLTNRQKTEYELSVSKDNGCYLCGTVAANSTGLQNTVGKEVVKKKDGFYRYSLKIDTLQMKHV